ncbi:MAG: phosphoglycerate dehydrogenase [Acidobacteria bacterium]|nr:phosphoglycerate dehydrogenase [Acidobacteriota bacterium]
MKIVVADDLPASALEILRAEAGWVVDARSGRQAAALAADLADADALLVRSATKVDLRLLEAAPVLRIVARAGTGVDNVDVTSASARGILVVNAPGANSISVAEHTCALMLALARSVPAADRAMKDGRWEKRRFLGTELRGKTLGVAGLGRIGQEVAQRARAFGMRIVAHDPYISKEVAASLGAELLSLDDLCATADYLTLHLPATAETRHVFNDDRFSRCKPGLRLINTARGELIDEAALKRAIDSGIVAGAALDVFEREPPPDWSLARMPQVIATPHIAASTEEAQELVGVETAATVRDFLRDGVVRNAVNFPSIHPDELQRLQPWIRLSDQLGALVSQMGTAGIEALGVRYYGALVESRGVEVIAASAAAGVLRRARHRDRRDPEFPFATLHESRFNQTADRCGRALGRRYGVRAQQSPARVRARGRRRGAARRHDADHRQRRPAGRHRRSRHDSGPPSREHRELRPRTQRAGGDRRRQRGRGRRRAACARRRNRRAAPRAGDSRGLGRAAFLARSAEASRYVCGFTHTRRAPGCTRTRSREPEETGSPST